MLKLTDPTAASVRTLTVHGRSAYFTPSATKQKSLPATRARTRHSTLPCNLPQPLTLPTRSFFTHRPAATPRSQQSAETAADGASASADAGMNFDKMGEDSTWELRAKGTEWLSPVAIITTSGCPHCRKVGNCPSP